MSNFELLVPFGYHHSGMYRFQFEEGQDLGGGERIYTVSELNREARELLETAFPCVWVEGEVSGFKHHSSGHMYLTLKDEEAEISAAIFAADNRRLAFTPEDGQEVLAFGRVTLFERRGRYQLIIKELRPAGLGRLQLEFERLKERLAAEGLFDERYKKPLPPFPQRIGIVTSPEGAAIRDICTIISRRYPAVELFLFPARVQGEGAAEEIARQVVQANEYSRDGEGLDLLIVGRGGGSLEDLWAFNEEVVARAIFDSEVPVISAVGHEVDFTIADFVADYRAPTPTAAAQVAVPDREELLARVTEDLRGIVNHQRRLLERQELRLKNILRSYAFRLTGKRIEEGFQMVDELGERLTREIVRRVRGCEERLDSLVGRLEAANPAAILARGYAIATAVGTGEVIRSARQVAIGDRLKVGLHQGELLCEVEEVKES